MTTDPRECLLTTVWTTWIEPLTSLVEIGLLFAAVWLTISQFTRSRASSYIERFNASDAIESRVAVDRWLAEHSSARERLLALEADPELRTHVRRFTNLFQELGAAYEFRVAHRKTVRVLFDALVVGYWESLSFWIRDYRAQTDPTLYARFESLYWAMHSHAREAQRRTQYVVAYGSLMDTRSLAKGLRRKRKVSQSDLVPVILRGWARRWSIGEAVRAGPDKAATVAAFLDVAREEGSELWAAIVCVSPRELARLEAREKNYKLVDVTADTRLTGDRPVESRAVVWCFVGAEEHRVDRNSEGVVILDSYLKMVSAAARTLAPEAERCVESSAARSGFEVLAGEYEFVDRDQAALV